MIESRGFDHLQPEQRRDIAVAEQLGRAGRSLGFQEILPGAGEQLFLIDAAQHKKKFGFFVESGANTIERRGNVLAHVCPVRTATG